MSWQALSWAGKIKVGSPAAKSLLILLANFADEAGECYPTFEKLSEMSELSYRAVQDNIGKLESLGLIERKRARNAKGHLGITRYQLCLEVQSVAIHRQQMPVDAQRQEMPVDHRQQMPVASEGEPPATDAGQVNHQPNHQEETQESDEGFEEFWKACPKRQGHNPQKPARVAYARALAEGATPAALLGAARAWAATAGPPSQFIPRVSTWLDDEAWRDLDAQIVEMAGFVNASVFIPREGPGWSAASSAWQKLKGKTSGPIAFYSTQQRADGYYFPKECVLTAEAAA